MGSWQHTDRKQVKENEISYERNACRVRAQKYVERKSGRQRESLAP